MALRVLSYAMLGSAVLIAAGKTANASFPTSSVNLATSDEIVQQLVEHNKRRADELKSYTDERHYTVVYHGFPVRLRADMVVEARYDAPTTKQFRIVSETGSKLLLERVLKKLLDSEKEAAQDSSRTALTPQNYTFSLLGQEAVRGRRCYRLHVEPKVESKFLYRGDVYVDAEDYAVTQIEAGPARNPSFWIKKTQIHHKYAKTGEFWLPQENRSETTVRMGGTAVLTIEYGPYRLGVAKVR